MAIARAESGFRTNAEGDKELARKSKEWDYSIGLMQIRSYDDPTRDPKRDSRQLYDPEFNARSAYKIYKGSNDWRAWQTSATKLGFKGGASGSSASSSSTDTSSDNFVFNTGNKELDKTLNSAFKHFNKTGEITDSTVGALTGLGGSNSSLSGMLSSALQSGITNNYGGVTFNVTTPADNKSFIESIKKALSDMSLGKLIGNK